MPSQRVRVNRIIAHSGTCAAWVMGSLAALAAMVWLMQCYNL